MAAAALMGKCLSRQPNSISGEVEKRTDHLDLNSTMDSTTSPSESSVLSIFHEDILHHILSYNADVPFELSESGGARDKVWPTDSQSTLTHTLPLVCKLFYKLSSKDMYWKVRAIYICIFMHTYRVIYYSSRLRQL